MRKSKKAVKRRTDPRLTKVVTGTALLRAMNEWKNAGGSDVDMLLALDDFVTESIKRSTGKTDGK
jgi:hypothetical protein